MEPNSKFQKGRLERLEKALYSRNENLVPKDERSTIEERNLGVQTSWGENKSFEFDPTTALNKNKMSFFSKFLIGSLLFFTISLGIALFIFFGGVNLISSNNLDVKIIAPSSISSGEELPIGLSIINGNRADLEEVFLFVDYPEGAQSIGDGEVLSHDKISLGVIKNGASTEYSLRNLLFGEKDSIKTFIFRIEYRVKGSNATFSKEKTYDVSIGSSPLLFKIDYPKEINSGQEVKISIDITSNSSVVLKNSLVKIEYPYGFTYKTSNIKPVRDNSIWNVGDLKNGDKKNLVVTGVLVGQNEEDKTFRISSGIQSTDTSKDFDTNLVEEDITVGIRKSFFDLRVNTLNPGAVPIGQFSAVVIKWQNTLPEKIINAKIQAKISGNIIDRSHVSVGDGGFYESSNSLVFWDKNNNSKFTQLLPGDGGQVSLSVISISDPVEVRKVKNPHMDVHVVMTGNKSGEDSSTISSEADFVIKLLSNLTLTSKSYRSIGSFSNGGPIPPKADTETTYTVTWTVTNTTNDLTGVFVRGKLPVGVTWKGEVSPLSEKINYDPDTRVITWNIGNVSYGTGFTNSPREVSFKLGITPSINQVGFTPSLVTETRATATDTWTTTNIDITALPVTTEYADPGFKSGDGAVIK
ncbi:MAG TPA: hypothetical protein VGC58_02225 [Candidatus Paceibacterota bacterium]